MGNPFTIQFEAGLPSEKRRLELPAGLLGDDNELCFKPANGTSLTILGKDDYPHIRINRGEVVHTADVVIAGHWPSRVRLTPQLLGVESAPDTVAPRIQYGVTVQFSPVESNIRNK